MVVVLYMTRNTVSNMYICIYGSGPVYDKEHCV